MDIILGVGTLVLVLIIMTLFLILRHMVNKVYKLYQGLLVPRFTTGVLKLRNWWRIPC